MVFPANMLSFLFLFVLVNLDSLWVTTAGVLAIGNEVESCTTNAGAILFDELSEFVGFATLLGLRLITAVPCGNKEPLHCIEVFFALRSLYGLRRVLVVHGQFVITDDNHDGLVQFEGVLVISING